ncbi:MAG TPA: NAD(P)H-hydrate dehydratase [Chloroflexota bacterium]|nr:NAD(P)H-hydrate dehydratase [Chloroflexota bacterium]
MKIVSVAQMRALEAAAFASGIREAALQEWAGHAVAEEVWRLLKSDERVAVMIGHGNNGRDGAVAAEWLLRHQIPVDLMLAPRHAITADELSRLKALGASIVMGSWSTHLRSARVAIDAIAGIGVHGALREPLAFMVPLLNLARAEPGSALQVVSVDIPSGIDADTGAIPGEAVWADVTVTLGGVKQGLLRFPAAERVGRLIPREIGIPATAAAGLPYNCLVEADLSRLVPARPLDAHKYRFGRALVIAGSDHFPGAAALCSTAAARSGAGLVTLAASRDVRLAVAAHTPEVTYTQQDVRPSDGPAVLAAVESYLQSHNAVLLGPGLGRSAETTAFVRAILQARPAARQFVIDADALVALAEIADWPTLIDQDVILTPHQGELERLNGQPLSNDVPFWVHAGRLAQEWGCTLVAKGPCTCIARPDGRVDVWPRPNSALATGGTGDVLAGITAGLLAQRLRTWDAARLAVGLHGLAAERVVERGCRTLLASDLLSEIPLALGALARATRPR